MRAARFALPLALLAGTVSAQDACTLPGELVAEDPTGDHLLAPTGEGFSDITTLHIGEPGGTSTVVFTFKMADLATLPPNTLWAIRFATDVLPADADEYFVAMLTGPDAGVHFVHGSAAPADGSGGTAPLLFSPAGSLDPSSAYAADGTITLVLDKSQVGGLEPGGAIFQMGLVTHRITPTDGTVPFAYGFRAVSSAVLSYDDGPDGYYQVIGNEACAPKSGSGGLVGGGSMNALTLASLGWLGLLTLLRRRAA